jgi:hypothetical protein
MQLARPAIAEHPFRFGRGRLFELAPPAASARGISDDVKLFATTFIAGFVFVSIFLA